MAATFPLQQRSCVQRWLLLTVFLLAPSIMVKAVMFDYCGTTYDSETVTRINCVSTPKPYVTIPTEIGLASKLLYVDFSDSGLESFPTEMGKLERLVSIIVLGNPVHEFPVEMWGLSSLLTIIAAPSGGRFAKLPITFVGISSGLIEYITLDEMAVYAAEYAQKVESDIAVELVERSATIAAEVDALTANFTAELTAAKGEQQSNSKAIKEGEELIADVTSGLNVALGIGVTGCVLALASGVATVVLVRKG